MKWLFRFFMKRSNWSLPYLIFLIIFVVVPLVLIFLYAFQDADNCQMHMYMPTSSFESFFANISVVHLADRGELDLNDKEAVKAVFAGVENAIESINVSLIFKSNTIAL